MGGGCVIILLHNVERSSIVGVARAFDPSQQTDAYDKGVLSFVGVDAEVVEDKDEHDDVD